MIRPFAGVILLIAQPFFLCQSYQLSLLTLALPGERRSAYGGVSLDVRRRSTSLHATRRSIISSVCAATAGTLAWGVRAHAAPPIAVIAEELGYFPVTNANGDTVYVGKRVARESSQQAQDLADYLVKKRVVLAGTYWCPHTSRQKELLGRQAFAKIPYVECSGKGYGGNPTWCISKQVDGYPTWVFPDGKRISGERPLDEIAMEVGFRGFDGTREKNLPPPIGASACSIKKK